jgi:hypothetical protein
MYFCIHPNVFLHSSKCISAFIQMYFCIHQMYFCIHPNVFLHSSECISAFIQMYFCIHQMYFCIHPNVFLHSSTCIAAFIRMYFLCLCQSLDGASSLHPARNMMEGNGPGNMLERVLAILLIKTFYLDYNIINTE